jgi:hypothetical protein
MLGVTLKTAWFMSHRIREAMRVVGVEPMGGAGKTVEADETFIGRIQGERKRRSGWGHKNAVLTLVQRGGGARSFHIDDTSVSQVHNIVRDNVARETALMTDEARHYENVGERFASHETVKHSADEYVRYDGDRIISQHRRGLLFDLQARHEGRLSALQRKAFAPLFGGV